MDGESGGWMWLVVDVAAVVALGIVIAWATIDRNRRRRGVAGAIAPSDRAARAGRANRWQDWANVGLGVWLFVSPWLLGLAGAAGPDQWAATNAWLVGALLALIALAAVYAWWPPNEYIALALAGWLILSPWVLQFASLPAAAWNHVAVGGLVILFAAWDLYDARHQRSASMQTR
jgi:hypothetical protein